MAEDKDNSSDDLAPVEIFVREMRKKLSKIGPQPVGTTIFVSVEINYHDNRGADMSKNKSTVENSSGVNIVQDVNTVGNITNNVNNIGKQGNSDLAKAIADLTSALQTEPDSEDKKDAMESLEGLSEQLAKPKEEQRKSMIKGMIGACESSIPAITAVVGLWEKVKDLIPAS